MDKFKIIRVLSMIVLALAPSCHNASHSAVIQRRESIRTARTANAMVERAEMTQLTKGSVKYGSKILLIGDSLAVGMGPTFAKIASAHGFKPEVHAVVGSNTLQWIDWITADLKKYTPRLVILSLGTNDAMIVDRIRAAPDTYRRLQDAIDSTGAIVVWISPPRIPSDRVPHLGEIRAAIMTIAANYFDSTVLNIERGADKIHSSPRGYSMWFEEVWAWIVRRSLVATERSIE